MDYKEKLRLAKEALESGSYDKETIKYIFPELKESEDEKIRKVLIDMFKAYNIQKVGDFTNKEIIAWLEKQGEQKPINDTDEEIVEAVKDTSILDLVKPRFKVGDWVVNNKTKDVFFIKSTNSGYCTLEDVKGDIYSPCLPFGSDFHLWTLKDAEDGDVLQLGEVTAIFKKYIGNENCICYCSFCKDGGFEIPIENGEDNVYGCYDDTIPATKEQRDLLFSKMNESGYEWDAEKKELKKIEDKPLVIDDGKSEIDYCFTKMMNGEKVSSGWGEEDEEQMEFLIALCDDEQDKCAKYSTMYRECNETKEWLKSLKDRYTWKPSDEQIKAIRLAKSFLIDDFDERQILIELEKQLKELKG